MTTASDPPPVREPARTRRTLYGGRGADRSARRRVRYERRSNRRSPSDIEVAMRRGHRFLAETAEAVGALIIQNAGGLARRPRQAHLKGPTCVC